MLYAVLGLYMCALCNLPNREYFPAIAYTTEHQLTLMIANVLGIVALELLTFIGTSSYFDALLEYPLCICLASC